MPTLTLAVSQYPAVRNPSCIYICVVARECRLGACTGVALLACGGETTIPEGSEAMHLKRLQRSMCVSSSGLHLLHRHQRLNLSTPGLFTTATRTPGTIDHVVCTWVQQGEGTLHQHQ
jgi:hypothetical protein